MELIYFVIVGAIAGLIASKVMNTDASLLMIILLGVLGGFVGGWGLGQLGIMLPWGMVGEILTAALGAIVILFMHRLVTK